MANNKTLKKKQQRLRRRRRLELLHEEPVKVPHAVNNRQVGSRGPAKPRIMTNQNETRMSYEEPWTGTSQLAAGVNHYLFAPGKSGLSKLDGLANNWDHYRLEKAHVRYATSTGTTTTGHLYAGIDYNGSDLATTAAGVAALSPRADGPCYENQLLVVNPKEAMSKPIMNTRQTDSDNVAFSCSVYTDVANSGVVWCSYTVCFSSPVMDTSAQTAGLLAVASQSHVNNTTIAPNGVPAITLNDASISGATSQFNLGEGSLETKFDNNEPVNAGDQFVISSVAADTASNGSLAVQFLDAATGLPLPSSVVRPISVGARVGSIWTAIWGFVRPWVKPFIISAVETLLVNGSNSETNVHETYHLLSRRVPSNVEVSGDPLNKAGDVGAVFFKRDGTSWGDTLLVQGYDLSAEPSGAGLRIKLRSATRLPAGSTGVITIKASGSTTLGTAIPASGVQTKYRETGAKENYIYFQTLQEMHSDVDIELVNIPLDSVADGDIVICGFATVAQAVGKIGTGTLRPILLR